jgi:hypothetical protein
MFVSSRFETTSPRLGGSVSINEDCRMFFEKTKRRLREQQAELVHQEAVLRAKENDLQKRVASEERRLAEEQARVEETEARAQQLIASRIETYPHIAKAWADWELALAKEQASELRKKKHPARTAAETVKAKGKEMAELRRQLKLTEYVNSLYEFHFPWLTDLRDLDEELDYAASANGAEPDKEDPVAKLLSKEEWAGLTECERNQRALERYLRGRLKPWQLGRDYERYVGYLREQDGFQVTYHGIIHGFEDLGRDVIAEKNGSIEVIQCKRWAQHKEIHEKHVFQLFGTMVAAQIENPGKKVTGTFTTTTGLSARARQFADALEIRVEERFPLADYPRIKCNIARRDSQRIYHLPFDQQYDSTVIEPHRGEAYVMTCADAEAGGFRRAWRWKGGEGD